MFKNKNPFPNTQSLGKLLVTYMTKGKYPLHIKSSQNKYIRETLEQMSKDNCKLI